MQEKRGRCLNRQHCGEFLLSDHGMFYPLQVAAIAALNGSTDFMKDRNRMCQERRDVVVKGLIEEAYSKGGAGAAWGRIGQLSFWIYLLSPWGDFFLTR